jgi:hypothetical protein
MPLWKISVKNDSHLLFEISGDFTTRGIRFVEDVDAHLSTGLRCRFGHQRLDHIDTGKNNALTGTRQVRKPAMCDRIVLRWVRRIVGDPHCHARVLHHLCEIRFAEVRPGPMTATSIVQAEPRRRGRRGQRSIGLPPLPSAVTGPCTGVMARPQVDRAVLPLQIRDAVGHHHALRQTRQVMIAWFYGRLGGECPRPIQMANQLFFWVSLLTLGAPRVVYSSVSRAMWANGAARCAHSPVR